MTKTFKLIGMVMLTMLMSVGFTSCSDDDNDNDDNPIVGTWKYTDSDEELILTITFNSNLTGNVTVTSYEEGHQESSVSETFEYSYNAAEGKVTIVGSDLQGTWTVTVTASYLMLGTNKFIKV